MLRVGSSIVRLIVCSESPSESIYFSEVEESILEQSLRAPLRLEQDRVCLGAISLGAVRP